MLKTCRLFCSFLWFWLAFAGWAPAPAFAAGADVDLALVLTVDVSRSMDFDEQRVQRDGYVSAFRDPEVINAITDGLTGRIAVTYVEWAATNFQTVVIPWTVIDGAPAAQRFADTLQRAEIESWNGTSISGALNFATGLLDTSGYNAIRRVIDVSGDGVNNNGLPLAPIRDLIIKKGITINGLPIILGSSGAVGGPFFFGTGPSTANLDLYYRDCVIGGPDSFLFTVTQLDEFATATRRKLIQEIASLPVLKSPGIQLAQQRSTTNCLTGDRFGP